MKKLLPIQYAKILYSLTKDINKKDIDEAIVEFVALLRRDQVLSKVDMIIDEFIRYTKEQNGTKFLTISSAQQLSDKQEKSITAQFGKNTEVTTEVDETLLGGIVIRTGNTILDGSLKTQLTRLSYHLNR